MAQRLNIAWQRKINALLAKSDQLDEVVSYAPAKRWLIARLARLGVPFRVYNLGGGVARVTTETDRCPCCGRALGG